MAHQRDPLDDQTPPLEQRRYWQHGRIVDIEWWQGGRLLLHPLPQPPALVLDFCEPHRTRIYPDLPCALCRERPRSQRVATGT